jgi:hypothetical protein
MKDYISEPLKTYFLEYGNTVMLRTYIGLPVICIMELEVAWIIKNNEYSKTLQVFTIHVAFNPESH